MPAIAGICNPEAAERTACLVLASASSEKTTHNVLFVIGSPMKPGRLSTTINPFSISNIFRFGGLYSSIVLQQL